MATNILSLGAEDVLALWPETLDGRELSAEEILHIFSVLGGFWAYDYAALDAGRPGDHAELKSKRCSDGFLFSKAGLKYYNVCRIMAMQLVKRFDQIGLGDPDYVAGIPKGATALGEHVAELLGAKTVEMKKENGVISTVDKLEPGKSLLYVEDFCTRGTGFKEAVVDLKSQNPDIRILPIELVIVNRGGLTEIKVAKQGKYDHGKFEIVAAATHRIQDWTPEECPLCKSGSSRIKPKATDENWEILMNSQKAA